MSITRTDDLRPLCGRRIGIVYGTYAPLHTGHQANIYRALSLSDGAIAITSGRDGDRGDQVGLPVNDRFNNLCKAFTDEDKLRIGMIDESDLPPYPNGWEPWLNRLLDLVRFMVYGTEHDYTIYVGEREYVDELNARLTELTMEGETWRVRLMDRSNIQISATAIRKDPVANWSSIIRPFRAAFTKRVAVVGPYKTGKSTLVRRLAHSVNAPYSKETYTYAYDNRGGGKRAAQVYDWHVLSACDYVHLARHQHNENEALIELPENQGVVFFDSCAIAAMVYAQLGLNEYRYSDIKKEVKLYALEEQIDLYLLACPATNDENKNKLFSKFIENFQQLGLTDKVVILDDHGDDDDPIGAFAQYQHALQAVHDRLRIPVPGKVYTADAANPELRSYIDNHIMPEYEKNDAGHQCSHIEYVMERSLAFVDQLDGVDLDVAYAAAAYHDIAHHIDKDRHNFLSAEMFAQDDTMKKFFDDKQRQLIVEAIEDHRASLGHEPRSIYGRILSSADRTTSVATSLRRVHAYSVAHYPEMTLDEWINRAYEHIVGKYGDSGYAPSYVHDLAFEHFKDEINRLVADKNSFAATYIAANNLQKSTSSS